MGLQRILLFSGSSLYFARTLCQCERLPEDSRRPDGLQKRLQICYAWFPDWRSRRRVMLDLVVRSDRVVTPHGVGAYDVAIQGRQIVAVAAPNTLTQDV